MPSSATSAAASKIARACMRGELGDHACRVGRRECRASDWPRDGCRPARAASFASFELSSRSSIVSQIRWRRSSWIWRSAIWCCSSSRSGRNSWSGGSSRRIIDRLAVHRPEEIGEVVALERKERGDRLRRARCSVGAVIIRCTIGRRSTLEEHVLGPAQADALGAETAGALGVAAVVGVGSNAQSADVVGPAEQCGEVRIVEVAVR